MRVIRLQLKKREIQVDILRTEEVIRAQRMLGALQPGDTRGDTPESAQELLAIRPEIYRLAKASPEEQLKAGAINPQVVEFVTKEMQRCFEEIKLALRTFCDLPEQHYTLISLWIIGTYAHDEFDTFPLIFINAVKGSGKTRLMKLIIALSKEGKMVLDLKESVLFRTAKGKTIGIDEFEGIASKEAGTIRTMINAAYKKGNAVERMAKVKVDGKEMFVPERFDLYTPLIIANIWGVEEVVQDRSIVVVLDKSDKAEVTNLMEDFDTNPFFTQLKRTLSQIQCTWCTLLRDKSYTRFWNIYTLSTLYTSTTLSTLYTHPSIFNAQKKEVPEQMQFLFSQIKATGLNGRNLELFFPLFIIAESLGTSVLNETLIVAEKIVQGKRADEMAESKDVALLEFISTQEQWRGGFYLVSQILTEFKYIFPINDEESKWINAHWIGRSLTRMNIVTKKRRTHKGIEVMLDIDKAQLRIKSFKQEVKE